MATRTIEDLSPKELAFCEFYTALGTPTCGNGKASAKVAGYAEKSAGNRAWKLLHRPAIKAKIHEIHRLRMDEHVMNPDRVLYDLEHTRILALDKGDLAVAARCSELQGKTMAMFVDRSIFNEKPEPEPPLTKEQEKIYRDAAHKLNLLSIKPHALNLEDAQRGRDNVAEVG